MPPQSNQNQASPFEIVTSSKAKKKGNRGLIVTILIVVFLILSIVAGVLLVRQQQNIAEKASPSNLCPGAEACPLSSDKTHLWDCHPAEVDGTVNDHICNVAGYVATCGAAHTQYCCPAVGANWTTNLAVCNSLASQSASPTATATPTVTPTATPNSCGGTCGSDSNCASGFICSGGTCRNPLCISAVDCTCGTASPTATATASATPAGTQSTPRPVPVTGVDWPTIVGVGVGAGAIILSILVAL